MKAKELTELIETKINKLNLFLDQQLWFIDNEMQDIIKILLLINAITFIILLVLFFFIIIKMIWFVFLR